MVGGCYKLILPSHDSPLRVHLGAQPELTVGSDDEEEEEEVAMVTSPPTERTVGRPR